MSENSIPHLNTECQTPPQAQQLSLIVEDGYHFNHSINEYEVWLDGQIINYATHDSTAWFMYTEALATRRLHAQRCPQDLMEVAR